MGRAGLPKEEQTVPMKKPAHHLIAEVPRKRSKAELTIGIDLGEIWSHYCVIGEDAEFTHQFD